MGDVTTWVAMREVLVQGDNILSFIAGETIYTGQVVGFAATGVANTVVTMNATASEHAVGVALHDATVGLMVSVASIGCVCNVANSSGSVAIETGDWVIQHAAACLGSVAALSIRADMASTVLDTSNDTTIDATAYIVGLAIGDIGAASYGPVLIMPYPLLYSDHTVV